ncbi:hypothetical protein OIU76_015086 [Salix suchowensis]|uniref:Uncharacterized protein n=1 Tax=Salix suchowensis TaxID=1278906 RepID=A0ABQ9BI21_9ROSI|nr:hypothetical protein OIU76_015086 [Salix suchowensis]KAJ6385476.1 hypothetical protein OIU77_028624 [Salix suchowensis]
MVVEVDAGITTEMLEILAQTGINMVETGHTKRGKWINSKFLAAKGLLGQPVLYCPYAIKVVASFWKLLFISIVSASKLLTCGGNMEAAQNLQRNYFCSVGGAAGGFLLRRSSALLFSCDPQQPDIFAVPETSLLPFRGLRK